MGFFSSILGDLAGVAGGALGSFLLPGVGTAIGGIGGSAIGNEIRKLNFANGGMVKQYVLPSGQRVLMSVGSGKPMKMKKGGAVKKVSMKVKMARLRAMRK